MGEVVGAKFRGESKVGIERIIILLLLIRWRCDEIR